MATHPELVEVEGLPVEVIRTGRQKTAAVRVREGRVVIAVPRLLPRSRIEALLARKAGWIKKKLLQQSGYKEEKPREYVSGEPFPYLGREYRLAVECGRPTAVKLRQGRLWVRVPEGCGAPVKIRDALVQWYRSRAEQRLREKVVHYSRVIGVSPAAVNIRTFRSRWGSCDSRGRVQFNWKIILAPDRIVDYLVVHELCHLIQHNHSPAFWNCVGKVLPGYRECREWLRQNERLLQL